VKLALITGGFRRLGSEIARRLAGEGYHLALHGIAAAMPDDALARELEARGTIWKPFQADLANAAEIDSLLGAVEEAFGRSPNVLVNNAAMFADDDWQSVTMDSLLAHYAVNAAAGVILAQGLARGLSPDERGVVVNILDQRVANPHGDQLSYTLSKQAAAAATRTLALALAPRVRVCGIAPGLTLPTPAYGAGQVERLADMMPLQQLPRASDIVDALVYLLGAEAVTGQILFVDGGASLRSFDRDFVHLAVDGERSG
jgi:pteridine reductase